MRSVYTFKQRVKLRVAYLLNRIFPRRYCWADLVMWAVWDVSWEDVGCPDGCGYCGKCEGWKP